MALELSRHKFTADEYEQLGRSGIFTEDDRVELLDGDIVEMSPLGPRHVRSVNRLTMLFAPRLVGYPIVQGPELSETRRSLGAATGCRRAAAA